jgi:hypothetical protein
MVESRAADVAIAIAFAILAYAGLVVMVLFLLSGLG